MPLCCATALAGCADVTRLVVAQNRVTLPAEALQATPWPPAPKPNGRCGKSVCQSQVAAWIETEVKPAFDDNVAIIERAKVR